MFNLEIETLNDAFDDGDDGRNEISRILRDTADRLQRGMSRQFNLIDTNGNIVGKVHFYS